jgi:hypothetical protein
VEACVNGRFRRSYHLNIVVIKLNEVLKYVFLVCESENKEGTSSTSGKSVKKRKNRKYDSYLDFDFTSTEVDGE